MGYFEVVLWSSFLVIPLYVNTPVHSHAWKYRGLMTLLTLSECLAQCGSHITAHRICEMFLADKGSSQSPVAPQYDTVSPYPEPTAWLMQSCRQGKHLRGLS